MPPARSNGQLDEISEAIGRLDGRFEGVEQYIHQHNHDVRDISQKIDALGHAMAKDIAAVEARMDVRLRALELGQNTVSTGKKFVEWLMQTTIAILAVLAAFRSGLVR